ncbi:MAG TPA: sensor domain-containing diguanylate cyclase, partial [Steroidobacteraceae bacterium]|nr:sensor domain-containing diguanylate cyclase [Steroidobacteraceae bacterium]
MKQLAFGLGALAGLWCAALVFGMWYFMRWRRGHGTSSNATRIAVFDQWPTTALVLDPATRAIVAANPAALRSTGYSHEEFLRLPFTELFSAEGAADERVLLARLQDSTARAPVEMRQRCKDGSFLNVEATAHRLMLDERPVLAVTVHDVTVRRVVESKLLQRHQHLEQLAHHDQLTGLPNRLYLAAHLPEALAEAKQKGTLLAVLFLDLDRFKHVNDSRGHETGDKLLKTVAQRIRQTMRAQDVVVRMGGDEFVVVLKDVESNDRVNEAAERINQALSAPMVVDGRTLVTTVSIGVALYPRDGIDMGELLRHSDTAMYQAKDRGRNNFQLFSPGMDRKLKERMAIETSLRNALQRKQLDV